MNYDEIWEVMNDVEEAFSQVKTIEFLTDEIQRAVDAGDIDTINDAAHALIAFLPLYQKNYDEKFMKAWEKVVLPLHNDRSPEMSYQEICKYLRSQSPEVSP